jgi:hypothetical protein
LVAHDSVENLNKSEMLNLLEKHVSLASLTSTLLDQINYKTGQTKGWYAAGVFSMPVVALDGTLYLQYAANYFSIKVTFHCSNIHSSSPVDLLYTHLHNLQKIISQ